MHRSLNAALCFGLATIASAQLLPPQFEELPEPLGPNSWRLTWSSEVDKTYRLDRSFDLLDWFEVDTVVAVGPTTFLDDHGLAAEALAFWRVVELEALSDAPLVVGDLAIGSLFLDDGQSTLDLALAVGGTEQVSEVIIRDGGDVLGNAFRGFGDTWNYQLQWDADAPSLRELTAEVRTLEGSVEQTGPLSFLLADPSKFVPLSAEGDPVYGGFVPFFEGSLSEFLYYPEGLADSGRSTGVCFWFGAGSQVLPPNPPAGTRVSFRDGQFFRGPNDRNPVQIAGSVRTLEVDQLTPLEVATAFDLPPGPIELDWGNTRVSWESGELGTGGWQNLQVELPLVDFDLPVGRVNARVMQDPSNGELFLVVCYSGEWSPLPDGMVFRIPSADPLKIYLSRDSGISAHGTAEATFPNGAEVRGSISWRYPNFEFSFEGKGIVIPALDLVRQIAPPDPATLPIGDTSSDLDDAAAFLAGYQKTMRGLATGGAAQADTQVAASATPLPTPTDPAGAALEAWAGRLISWNADRAGQTLDQTQSAELTGVVQRAAATAEGSSDLPTVLKFLRDFLALKNALPDALGDGEAATALQAALSDAELRFFAAAERIIANRSPQAPNNQFSESMVLLKELNRLALPSGPAPAPANKNSPRKNTDPETEQRFKEMVAAFRQTTIFDALFTQELAPLSSAELLAFLERLIEARESYGADLPPGETLDIPPGFPFEVKINEVLLAFFNRHNADFDRVPLSQYAFAEQREFLLQRAHLFELWQRYSDTSSVSRLPSNDSRFLASTPNLVTSFLQAFKEIPLAEAVTTCRLDWDWVESIQNNTVDGGAESDLDAAYTALDQCDSLVAGAIAQADNANRCDELWQDLRRQPGVSFEPYTPLRHFPTPTQETPPKEGDIFIDLTGRYESEHLVFLDDDGTRKEDYLSMQLNQGGRYLEGALQQHTTLNHQSSEQTTLQVQGLFTSRSEVAAGSSYSELALRMKGTGEDGSPITSFATAQIIQSEAEGTVMLLRGIGAPRAFELHRVSHRPLLSPTIMEALGAHPGTPGAASQDAPMHARMQERLAHDFLLLDQQIQEYARPDVALGSSAEDAIVAEIEALLTRIASRGSEAQKELIISFLETFLIHLFPFDELRLRKITRDPLDVGRLVPRGRWDVLLAIAKNHGLAHLLCLTDQQIEGATGKQDYQYDIEIELTAASVGVLVFQAGGYELLLKVTRTRGEEVESFRLTGSGGTYSPSLGSPVNCGKGLATKSFRSPFKYEEADFAGEVLLYQIAAGSTQVDRNPKLNEIRQQMLDTWNALASEENKIPEGFNSAAIGTLKVFGSFRFPGISIPLTGISANPCIQNALGIDVGPGVLEASETEPEPGADLAFEPLERKEFKIEGRAHLDGGIFFESNRSTLSPCAMQYLREFVTVNRALFIGTRSKIEVHAYTDTVGSRADNEQLSDDRAASTKYVLESLLGPALLAPITIQSFGETPAANAIGQDPNQLPEPPGVPDPLFRRVDLIVGGHIVASITER